MRPQAIRVTVWLVFGLLFLGRAARGADRTIEQFVHKAWVAKDGAPASITAITQTTDGVLWLASSQGLYRFDGVEFDRVELRGEASTFASIRSLLACLNGDLWVGSAESGVSLLRNGTNRNYTSSDGFPDGAVMSLAQDREGAIWAATQSSLARFDGKKWRKIGADSGFEGRPVGVYVDRHGTLWAATQKTILYLPAGQSTFHRTGMDAQWVMHMQESPNGTIWMAETTRAVRPMPPSSNDSKIEVGSAQILFDREGSLWITTLGDGLRRVPHPDRLTHEMFGRTSDQIESFTTAAGLSADYASTIFQDREGNVWVGTAAGLDRFTKGAVSVAPAPGKLARTLMAPGEGGDVWMGAMTRNIGRVHENRWFSAPPLPLTVFSVAADPKGGMWWAGSLAIFETTEGRFTKFDLPHAYRQNFDATRIAVDGSGAPWISGSFGTFVWRGGEWRPIDLPSDFPGKNATIAYADADGRVWIGYREDSILLIDGLIRRVFSEKDGLRAGAVEAIFARGDWTWIAGSQGLQLFDGQHFRDIAPAGGRTFGSVSGVVETSEGSLWLNARDGIIRISPESVAKLEAGTATTAYSRFDNYDGLPGATQQVQPYPTLIQAHDGKLWFGTSGGPVWIDPKDIPRNELPPAIAIRSVTANGRRYGSFANLRLPKLTRDLEVAFTALSFTVPERVRFRYRLDGSDNEWHDAGTRRHAFYTNLGPGRYRFRVIACNNDGLWNEEGAVLDFSVLPTWYQTSWFKVAYGAMGLALFWGLYRYRIHQIAREFNSRLEERVRERTRIARELHDTLLQSFQASLVQMQAARNILSRRPEQAVQRLDSAIRMTAESITEARGAIQQLRSQPTAQRDLPALLTATGQELAHAHETTWGPVSFRVVVEGEKNELKPLLQDEVYRIVSELLRNAFKHSQASEIEAEVRFEHLMLLLYVRDNGKGIKPDILNEGGRAGHWGLAGINERAKQIGGRLEFWSEAGRGTEARLTVPASVAYKTPHKPWSFRQVLKKGSST